MNMKLLLFATACLSYFMIPVMSTSLMAAAAAGKGAVIGAGYAGVALSGGGGETVLLQAKPRTVPAHDVQVVVQQPAEYKPVHPISLVPVATISSNSFTDKLSNLWSGISNSISTKTRAVGDFLRSFRGPPRIILISFNKTTTTTKKPKKTTTEKPTTHQSVILEIVGLPQQRIAYPYQVPVPVAVVNDYDKK